MTNAQLVGVEGDPGRALPGVVGASGFEGDGGALLTLTLLIWRCFS